MSDKPEPSPRPWRVIRALEDEPARVIDSNDEYVAIELTDADALLIVDAVNERDRLRDQLAAAIAERDRLRDIVRRMADLSESLLANYEYRYREDANSMAFVGNTRDFIREARAAIGEDKE